MHAVSITILLNVCFSIDFDLNRFPGSECHHGDQNTWTVAGGRRGTDAEGAPKANPRAGS